MSWFDHTAVSRGRNPGDGVGSEEDLSQVICRKYGAVKPQLSGARIFVAGCRKPGHDRRFGSEMEISEPFCLCAGAGKNAVVERMGNTMRDSRPISVPMVAIVSAAIYGGIAVLCVPALSFVFHLATSDGGPAVTDTSLDTWMTMAVLAPVFCALLGFVSGMFMASMFNLFVRQTIRRTPAREAVHQVRFPTISGRPKPKILVYARDVPAEPEAVRAHARRAHGSRAEF
jgi:hypothetical protein